VIYFLLYGFWLSSQLFVDEFWYQEREGNCSPDNQKIRHGPRWRVSRNIILRSPPPSPFILVHMCPIMLLPVKMWHIIYFIMPPRLLAGAHPRFTSSPPSLARICSLRSRMRVFRPRVLRRLPLCIMFAPSSTPKEARGRPTELCPSLTQATGRPSSHRPR
jgi:hypothetical protein